MQQEARIGIIAAERIAEWQSAALASLAARGASVVARFAPGAALEPQAVAGLDLVLAFEGPVPDAARSARWGCWTVVLPGEPPGVQAYERGDPSVEVRLHRHGSGRVPLVVARAVVAVAPSYTVTRQRILDRASVLPADGLARMLAGAGDGQRVPADEEARAAPASGRRVRHARATARRVRGALSRLLLQPRWRVGRLRTPLRALVGGAPVSVDWLDLPRGSFWADPFPFVADGRAEVLCEGYDYALDRGYLARAAIDGDRTGEPRVLARFEHHLSYPYVVEDGATRYVVPEEHQARRVALYEPAEDGLRLVEVLLEGIAAVDPTLVRHDGRWWLFLTDADRDDNGELLLYHAPALRGPWTPHPLNPVVRDVRSARPGGTPFVLDGVLYRPAQDCSTGYGDALSLARIDTLTPTAYRQRVVTRVVPPSRGPGRRGIHTLAVRDGIALVDGKDLVVEPAATLSALRGYVRRIVGRGERR